MPRPWKRIDTRDTRDGVLELRQRGEHDFMITIAGRVLMTSMLHRSEVQVAELGLRPIAGRKAPRVLTAGLGLGYTLRALLDHLPTKARVRVAELNDVVVEWCRGPVAALTAAAALDPRVEIVVGDVMASVEAAASGALPPFDAIVLDLYVGPGTGPRSATEALYGRRALESVERALTPGGAYAVWGEERDTAFEDRLRRVGFDVEVVTSRGKGVRHAVYVAQKARAAAREVTAAPSDRRRKR